LLDDGFAQFSTISALEDSYFQRTAQFDKFAQQITLESSDAQIMHFIVAIIKTAFVFLPWFVFPPVLYLDHTFLKLMHELSESLVDDGFEFVELSEDEGSELHVVVEEVSEGEGDMMF